MGKWSGLKKLMHLAMLSFVMITFAGNVQNQIYEYSKIQDQWVWQKAEEEQNKIRNTSKEQDEKQSETESSQEEQTKDQTKETENQVAEVSAENGYAIMGESSVDLNQMVAYFHASGHEYPSEALGQGGAPTIEDYCQMYLDESAVEGVRAEIPYVQSMKETGWLQFEGVCDVSQYNFAGMGATGGDVAGESYADVRTGIRAQIQHLKAYATTDPLTEACVDARYALVQKASAPYVQWLGQQENPQGTGWATAPEYGISIAEMIQNLKSF